MQLLGPVYTKRLRQRCDNSAMMPAMLFSLKTVDSLQNGLQPHSGVTPSFSMKTLLLATSQSCGSVDSDAGCKQTLTESHIYSKRYAFLCKRTKFVKKQILTFSSRLLMIQETVFLSFK